ncbi:MAG: TonB C-terminal domain-containing protein [Kiritimatiellia bacterium]|nr:TonB C-terminal domain-containing protein [Kiritimatiellia bacterium]
MVGSVERTAYCLSFLIHAGMAVLLVVVGLCKGCCTSDEVIVPMDMTVVLDENLRSQPDEPVPSQDDLAEPENIPPPPPISAESLVSDRTPPRPQEKPKPPKPFVKGRRITVRDNQKQTKPSRPTTERKLSEDEIRRLLNAGARPGSRNQVAPNEVSRCLALIKDAFYRAWKQPTSCPNTARLQIAFNRRGEVTSYRLTGRSGSVECDNSILRAAAEVPRVAGLSESFLSKYGVVTIEFRLN